MAELNSPAPAPAPQAPMPQVDSTLKKETMPTQNIKPLYRATQIVWYILLVIEVLMMFRFFLKLVGANTEAGFTKFIYTASYPFAGPFAAVFKLTQVQGSIFEWSTLLSMFFYFIVAWLIVKAMVMAKPVSTEEADAKLPSQEKL